MTSNHLDNSPVEMANGTPKAAYRRIILKLSGEALADANGFGIDPDRAADIAAKIKEIHDLNVQIAVVIGAGNLWRGVIGTEHGMEQSTADYMGMIATVMNALALQDALEKAGVQTRVMTAIQMHEVAEPYIRRRAIRHMEKGRVVILAAGTGNPYFTTDTAAALRALELDVDILLMAKNRVDGIYSEDPRLNLDARRYLQVSHQEAIERDLKVMDAAALALLRENNLPILVFNMSAEGAIENAVSGAAPVGTMVTSGASVLE